MHRAEAAQHFGYRAAQGRRVNPDQHPLHSGGISHRAENIENRAQAQFLARPDRVTHRAVVGRRKHEAHTNFVHTFGHPFRLQAKLDTGGLQHICAA